MSLDRRSLFSFHPGINFNYKQFDIGAYAENLINYDFNTSDFVKGYSETTYSGHLMYTYLFSEDDVVFRTMGRIRSNHTFGFNSGISFWVNSPKLGWVQTGFDSYYGLSLGVGVHLSNKLSVGFVYEKASRAGMQNLGGTYEFNLVFTLPSTGQEVPPSKGASTEEKNSGKSSTPNKKGKKNNQQNNNKVNDNYEIDDDGLEESNEIPEEEGFTNRRKNGIKGQEQSDEDEQLGGLKKGEKHAPKEVTETSEEKSEIVVPEKKVAKKTAAPRMSKILVNNTDLGYYVIGGVFSKEINAQAFMKTVKRKGVMAMSFVNARNNLIYVYLKYFDTLEAALSSYYSNLDNTYFEDIWILEVSEM
jgi:hypothetical protein